MTEAAKPLSTWTLYDSPLDMPGFFVLRRWDIHAGDLKASPEAFWSKDVESLRDEMRKRGLYCIPRRPADEPHIVEVWL